MSSSTPLPDHRAERATQAANRPCSQHPNAALGHHLGEPELLTVEVDRIGERCTERSPFLLRRLGETGYRAGMSFNDTFENVGKAIDAVGVGITALGALIALAMYAIDAARGNRGEPAYRAVRRRIGRAILLGLELLVAGDIIRSVVVAPSFRSVGVLAVIVVIRSFLSVTLELEISGRFPWQPATPTPAAAAPNDS